MTIIHSKTPTRERPKHDVYETPYDVAYSALQYLTPREYEPDTVLDIGAGNGVWGKAYRDRFDKYWDRQAVDEGKDILTGVEIRDLFQPNAYTHWHRGFDLLAPYQRQIQSQFDIVIGNPPYNKAEECVRFALSRKPREVLMLLKLSFLESQKRGNNLFKEFPPYAVYVSMRRISFFKTEKSSTGDYATALFHWKRYDEELYGIDYDYDWDETLVKWWNYKELLDE